MKLVYGSLIAAMAFAAGCKQRQQNAALRSDDEAQPADGQAPAAPQGEPQEQQVDESSGTGCPRDGFFETPVDAEAGSKEARHYGIRVTPAGSPPARTKVVVVGSGLTGLTTAYRLKKAGITDVIVLEKDVHVGGRINTIHFNDCTTAEAHMEEYFERSPAVPLLKDLGLLGTQTVEDVAHSTVRLKSAPGDRDAIIYPYTCVGFCNSSAAANPTREQARKAYFDGIFGAGSANTGKMLKFHADVWEIYKKMHRAHIAKQPLPADVAALMSTSFKTFTESRLPFVASEWVRATVEPEAAIEWDKVSALDGIDELRLFLDTPDTPRGDTPEGGKGGFGERNYHVLGGNINFINELVKGITPNTLFPQATVTAVDKTDGGVRVTYTYKGETKTIDAQYAVVTVPLYVINKIKFTPALSADKQKAINTTKFGSYIKIHYRLDPEAEKTWTSISTGKPAKPLADQGDKTLFTLLSDTNAGSIYDVTELHEKAATDAPSTVKPDITVTLLLHARFARRFIPKSARIDDIAENAAGKAPKEVAEAVKADMDRLFPGFSSHIKDSATYIYPTAVAYWPLSEHRSRFDHLAEKLREMENNVFIGGDTTEDSHSEGAVVAGERIAKELIEKLK